jgi:hypothetical protein
MKADHNQGTGQVIKMYWIKECLWEFTRLVYLSVFIFIISNVA